MKFPIVWYDAPTVLPKFPGVPQADPKAPHIIPPLCLHFNPLNLDQIIRLYNLLVLEYQCVGDLFGYRPIKEAHHLQKNHFLLIHTTN
jgi:hypothetical protein